MTRGEASVALDNSKIARKCYDALYYDLADIQMMATRPRTNSNTRLIDQVSGVPSLLPGPLPFHLIRCKDKEVSSRRSPTIIKPNQPLAKKKREYTAAPYRVSLPPQTKL